MDIVILDGHAVNPGDVSWAPLEKFAEGGSFTVYEKTAVEEAAARIGGASVMFTNKATVTDEVFAACPALRYIGILATGFNTVDTEAAARRGIAVTNVPDYSAGAVAQHIFALILEKTNVVHIHSESVMRGEWVASPYFAYWKTSLTELQGKTFGTFGFGSIGQKVAAVALAFGMKVIAYTRTASRIAQSGLDVKSVTLDELFAQADFLAINAPLNKESFHAVNERTLALMKPSAMLVNTARGPLVDEKAVRAALDAGRLACYAADVIEEEPMAADSPLLGAPNCILTPHIAWAPKETRSRLIEIAAENFAAFLRGERLNRIV